MEQVSDATNSAGPSEQDMFGCALAPYLASVDASLTVQLAGPGMVVMSLLSDAQELIDCGRSNAARQYINRAKYLIGHYKLGLAGIKPGA